MGEVFHSGVSLYSRIYHSKSICKSIQEFALCNYCILYCTGDTTTFNLWIVYTLSENEKNRLRACGNFLWLPSLCCLFLLQSDHKSLNKISCRKGFFFFTVPSIMQCKPTLITLMAMWINWACLSVCLQEYFSELLWNRPHEAVKQAHFPGLSHSISTWFH